MIYLAMMLSLAQAQNEAPAQEEPPAQEESGVVGVEGGVIDQEPLPDDGSGIATVRWYEIKATRMIEPKYPEELRGQDLPDATCMVLFSINEKGKPDEVTISDCPEAYHRNVERAAMKWRFEPHEIDGEAKKARFALKISFKQR